MVDTTKLYIYDLETYRNLFSFSGKFFGQSKVDVFELSQRTNNRGELLSWLSYLKNSGAIMVGYNNLGFDYEILHHLLNNPHTFDFTTGYNLAQQIITSQNRNQMNRVRPNDRFIQQLDLMKLHHFDNKNKTTSLKALQFAMRLQSIEDLPFSPHEPLTFEQMDKVLSYNAHDIVATESFLEKSMKMIEMRQELLESGVITGDVLNMSDVKLGGEYLIRKIGRHKCFSGSKAKQTFRESIYFKEIILNKIFYRTEHFQEVLKWFKKQVIHVNSDEPTPRLETKLANLDFYFGVGGAHASVESKEFHSNDTHVILDVDVSGMYPSIAVTNGFAPEHLGQDFVNAYKQLQIDRKQYKKGTAMNLTLKLANNGAFGNSDNPYHCFYDPRFPKQITINGQLQLLQLAEMFALIPGLQLIQCNTDGITAYLPRTMVPLFDFWKKDWEKETGLMLEELEYKSMWIRDVNNYIALGKNGEIKLKGAYWWPKTPEEYQGSSGSNWNKDFSMMIVQKVIEQSLVNGIDPKKLISIWSDKFDFMKRYKTPSGATVYIGETPMLKTVRYYVSKAGQPMKKIATPKGVIGAYKRKNGLTDAEYNKILKEVPEGSWDPRIHNKKKSKYEKTQTSVESGYLVKECNKASDFNWNDVDFDYYLEEIEKLRIGDRNV